MIHSPKVGHSAVFSEAQSLSTVESISGSRNLVAMFILCFLTKVKGVIAIFYYFSEPWEKRLKNSELEEYKLFCSSVVFIGIQGSPSQFQKGKRVRAPQFFYYVVCPILSNVQNGKSSSFLTSIAFNTLKKFRAWTTIHYLSSNAITINFNSPRSKATTFTVKTTE